MTVYTKSDEETKAFGQEFAKQIKVGEVLCFWGDLGAGKTTLIQGIAKGLGIKGRIASPTFIIVRRHKLTEGFLWHIDLYRLENIAQAKDIGIEEILADKSGIILIEWPEKIKEILPRPRWDVRLETTGENERRIEYEAIH